MPLALLTACGGDTGKEHAARPGSSAVPAALEVREGYALTPDSVRLWYRVVGAGKQTIVTGAANYFGHSLDSLATPDRRVVYYDIRGRGKTDSVPPSKMGIVEFDADDIDVIRKAVGADSIVLLGWSGGALSAFQYAAKYPARVTHLVLLTPVGPRWVPWWDAMRKNSAGKVDTAAAKRLAARVKAGEFAGNEVALCREQAALGLRTNWVDSTQWHLAPDVCDSPNEIPSRYGDFVPRLLAKLGKFDFRADLPRVRARTLVIHGEKDNPPLGGSREWVAGIPEARLLVIPGVGHWPHYEKPTETLGAIRAFLDGQWPAGSEPVAKTP
ncbi:MAG TPA: alpha/beta hydrolase [Gemmatimonadaceae bacterium]|nr:alpha/beta hydrolase [Gemmatimonadaceae bacterium]